MSDTHTNQQRALTVTLTPAEADKLAILAEVNGTSLADYAKRRLLHGSPPIPHTVNKRRVQQLEKQWEGDIDRDKKEPPDEAILNAIAGELPSLVHQRLEWSPNLSPDEIREETHGAFFYTYEVSEGDWYWENPLIYLVHLFTVEEAKL